LKELPGLLNRKEFAFFRRSLTDVPDALVLNGVLGEKLLVNRILQNG